jgi:transposase
MKIASISRQDVGNHPDTEVTMKSHPRPKKRSKIHRLLELLLGAAMPRSDREIARALLISKSTVARYRHRAHDLNLQWPAIEDLLDEEIKALFNKPINATKRKRQPDWDHVRKELPRKFVTLLLLWKEYRQEDPGTAMSYTHFTASYAQQEGLVPSVMRKCHKPGDRMEIDYSGDSSPYTHPETGTTVPTKLFVGTLPYSGLFFVTCTPHERDRDWVHGTRQMFEYIGGVPQIVTNDNARALMTTPRGSGRDPLVGVLFQDFARAYNFLPDPARVRRPKDKAAVEGTVGFAQRQILGALRDRVFYSLESLNAAIAVLVNELNEQVMQGYKVSRRQRFEQNEKHLLQPLPAEQYECSEYIELPPVPIDYVVHIHDHRYSVPSTLVGQRLDAKITGDTIEILHQRKIVARHQRNAEIGGTTISDEHRTPEHLAESKRNPEGLIGWAQEHGGAILAFCRHHFVDGCQPYLAMKKCEKLKSLVHKHGVQAVQDACVQALALNTMTVTDVGRLITLGEEQPTPSSPPAKGSRTKRNARTASPTHHERRHPATPSCRAPAGAEPVLPAVAQQSRKRRQVTRRAHSLPGQQLPPGDS